MTTKSMLSYLAVSAVLVSLTGCDKQSTAPASPPASTNTAASAMDSAKDLAGKAMDSAKDATAKAVDSTKAATTKAVDATKDFAGQAVDDVKAAAAKAEAALPGATDTVTAKYNEVVTNTKQYITDKKYQDALDELKKLSDVKLTDNQQKVVDGMKTDVQNWLSAGKAAVTNMLGN
jgi:hypothetical protein